MSQPHTTLSKPEHDRTAQQWAWQFLRRNPEYVAAYELLSSLTQEQLNQLSCLVARCKGLLLSEDLLNESVIGTLDLRFFDDKYLEDLDDLGETVEEYRAKASEILGADEQLELIVSRRFWLETYCLRRWIDPVQNTELDAETAAGIWAHHPFIEWGLASALWLPLLDGVDPDEFRPTHRPGRSFNASSEKVETKGPMVKGADGNMFIRSATVWGHDYELPVLGTSEVDVRFDLNLPLNFQIKRAKEELQKHQKLLRNAKILAKFPSQADRNGVYQEYLLILDRLKEGATPTSLALELEPVVEKQVRRRKGKNTEPVPVKVIFDPANPLHDTEKITETVRQKMVRALRLRDRDYKALAFL